MKAFLIRHKRLHIWLLVCLVLLGAFFVLQRVPVVMRVAVQGIGALRSVLGRLCSHVPFSVMELLCILLVLFVFIYAVAGVVVIVRGKGQRLQRTYSVLLGAVCCGLTVYAGFCWLWGITYYVDGFQEQSGVYAQDVAVEDLEAVTAYFAGKLRETADSVPRDADGLFAVPREQILSDSTHVYDSLEEVYPFLAFDDSPPKGIYLSHIMSRLDFTGVYCPFTGETNVNMDSPACLLPSTVAHELAHQRGIALEQECNFLAIEASTTCGLEYYAYSGWLLGYIYLGNALYKADQTRWEGVYETLPEGARADMQNNNAYWAQFRDSTVQKASNEVYDRFLKGYGEETGIQSYGTVVDLLVVQYREQAAGQGTG